MNVCVCVRVPPPQFVCVRACVRAQTKKHVVDHVAKLQAFDDGIPVVTASAEAFAFTEEMKEALRDTDDTHMRKRNENTDFVEMDAKMKNIEKAKRG